MRRGRFRRFLRLTALAASCALLIGTVLLWATSLHCPHQLNIKTACIVNGGSWRVTYNSEVIHSSIIFILDPGVFADITPRPLFRAKYGRGATPNAISIPRFPAPKLFIEPSVSDGAMYRCGHEPKGCTILGRLPLWFPTLTFALSTTWLTFTTLRSRRRRLRGLCPKCHYDLVGLAPSPDGAPATCPECGTPA
ncbi:MAG: hypothetical protein H7Y88_04795 [Phycisphaerales bacterium]|nr:hypothetical protein [Phycisphaerales bacterium]